MTGGVPVEIEEQDATTVAFELAASGNVKLKADRVVGNLISESGDLTLDTPVGLPPDDFDGVKKSEGFVASRMSR
ncbi:hypothetical protein [Phyllobacterium lublinensis]|jgi:hypothetical protein|uniref:hypothetical protein n=1 Tax=Phyllobacterium lublinensis TaxID=2875708 RepID=UPI001CCB777A|nr:hypothetical protein [Phyllobacterium sp. 2063]MBZ9656448.1 hypothetical protein [Phyllobacterium sp. 2063]